MRIRRWECKCGMDWEIYDEGHPPPGAPFNWVALCPECDIPGKILCDEFFNEDNDDE